MKYPMVFRTIAALPVLLVLLGDDTHGVTAFTTLTMPSHRSLFLGRSIASSSSLQARKTQTLARTGTGTGTFDPLNLASSRSGEPSLLRPASRSITLDKVASSNCNTRLDRAGWAAATALVPFVAGTQQALALPNSISQGYMDPANFQPVCPTSDGFYRFLQTTLQAIVGPDAFVEYGPLIAGGLLRVRLELCVVESFFKEAVGPFIEQNGVAWILPLHETVETFLAGAIFAIASTFILIGSTKIITVIITYTDLLVGLPFRTLGGFAFDRASGKPVTLDLGFGPFKKRVVGPPEPKEGEEALGKPISKADPASLAVIVLSGGVKYTGEAVGFVRQALEAVDSFVGRYLVLWASGYLLLKFVHFKIFPDFPDFL